VKEEIRILHTIKGRKGNWNGHILHVNCLLYHAIKGKTEGKIGVRGRRGRRSKKLLMTLRKSAGGWGSWKLKEDALDRIVWRTRFGRGCGMKCQYLEIDFSPFLMYGR
jgi:hypothetical protein